MARPEKTAIVDEIRSKLDAADAAVLTEYRGLTVAELAQLRGALRQAGTEYKVFKNTLARRAAQDSGLDDLVPLLLGPTAIAFVNGDAVMAAKALRDFGRQYPALVLKGGLLGTRVLGSRDIEALAEVQPRDMLLARLAGGFQAPLVKAAGLFQAFTRNFAYGIKAYVDQRVAAGEVVEVAPTAEAEPTVDTPTESEAPTAEAPTAEVEVEIPVEAEAAETGTEVSTESEEPAAEAADADTTIEGSSEPDES